MPDRCGGCVVEERAAQAVSQTKVAPAEIPPSLGGKTDEPMWLAAPSSAYNSGWNDQKTGMIRQVGTPRCRGVMGLAGLRREGNPVQARPVAGTWRPAGWSTRARGDQ
eukprot:12952722-Alexandrium_andersonii.AAC.1